MIQSEYAADSNSNYGERKLWAEVIQQAFYRATIGEASAQHFFRSHMFHQLCGMLSLPEQLIQARVASRLKHRPQQKT